MHKQDFTELIEQLKTIACVESIDHLLDWDQQVTMPPGATQGRGDQRAFIAGTFHRLLSSDSLGTLIAKVKQDPELSSLEKQIIDEAEWRVSRSVNMPSELAERIASLKVRTVQDWEKARGAESFEVVKSSLSELLEAFKERSSQIDSKSSAHQVMIEDYERGSKLEDLRSMFASLRVELLELVGELKELGAAESTASFGANDFSKENQAKLCKELIESIGFSFSEGRLDTTTHPFCSTCGPRDIRLTTRYHEDDLNFALTSALHEAGHGLYEQGLDQDYIGAAKGRYCSLGIHESQSIMWERHVGLSREFLSFYYPKARELFPVLSSINETRLL